MAYDKICASKLKYPLQMMNPEMTEKTNLKNSETTIPKIILYFSFLKSRE